MKYEDNKADVNVYLIHFFYLIIGFPQISGKITHSNLSNPEIGFASVRLVARIRKERDA